MIVRPLRAHAARGLLLAVAALPALLVACTDDDEATGPSAEVRGFCDSLFASPGFSCCSEADRSERQFAVRNRYQSAEDCANQLGLAAVDGRRAFDPQAASTCLAHVNGRTCGASPTSTYRMEEEAAGCGRVMAGQKKEGETCVAHEDCAVGLVCPPPRDTGGLSTCAQPSPINQGCIGTLSKTSVDHPACQPGLACTFVGQASACPLPPCLIFQCVPLGEQGEGCSGLDCAKGLACLTDEATGNPTCQPVTGPSAQGGPCRIPDQCADGLYCDLATFTCAPKKAAGEPCSSPTNTLLECKGFCKGDQTGVCVSFCGSD
jgi:hypothetical protein